MSSVNFADPVTNPIPSTRHGLVPTEVFSNGSVVDSFMVESLSWILSEVYVNFQLRRPMSQQRFIFVWPEHQEWKIYPPRALDNVVINVNVTLSAISHRI
jgi:hypothetical protein